MWVNVHFPFYLVRLSMSKCRKSSRNHQKSPDTVFEKIGIIRHRLSSLRRGNYRPGNLGLGRIGGRFSAQKSTIFEIFHDLWVSIKNGLFSMELQISSKNVLFLMGYIQKWLVFYRKWHVVENGLFYENHPLFACLFSMGLRI